MAAEPNLGELPTSEELVTALTATMRLTKGKSLGKAIDALVKAGKVRAEAAEHLKLATVYAQDRVRDIGSGQVVGGQPRAIDERYFEGSSEDLKEARTRQRTSSRKEYAESTPVEYRSIIKEAFNSETGKKMLHTALARRVKQGKLPDTERVRDRVAEAKKDTEFAGKVRFAPEEPEGPEVRPGVAGLKLLASLPGGRVRIRGKSSKPEFGRGTGMHGPEEMTLYHGKKVPGADLPAETGIDALSDVSDSESRKLIKQAMGEMPKTKRLHGRVEGNKLDALKKIANDESRSKQVRLMARTMYAALLKRQGAEAQKFGTKAAAKAESKRMSTAPRAKTRVVETKPEFIKGVGKKASRKVAVLGRKSDYAANKAARKADIEEKAATEFMARPTLRKPETLRLDTPSSRRVITGKKQIGGRVGRRALAVPRSSDEPSLKSPQGEITLRDLEMQLQGIVSPKRQVAPVRRKVVRQTKKSAKTDAAPRRRVLAKKVATDRPLPKAKGGPLSIYERGAAPRPRAGATG
jgi:hypothetical protein